FGPQACQLPQTDVQWIACSADQIAGHQRQMRTRLVGHIDGAGQNAFAQKGAEMNITQLNQAQAVEVLGQVWEHQILFPQRKIDALYENTVARRNRGSTQQCGSRGVQKRPPSWAITGFSPQPAPRNQNRRDQKNRQEGPGEDQS